MKERLLLVTDFATLRAGMIVVVVRCGRCASDHRGMLVGFERGSACMATNGTVVTEDTWEVVPHGACGCGYIGPYDVEVHRCVFRVIDGLENDQTTTTTKKREAVK